MISEVHRTHSLACNEENMNDDGTKVGPTLAGNTPCMSSYANVTGGPTISERFANTAYGFILRKRVAYPVGLDSMFENGPWFIRNNPLILKKWNPDVNLLKEDVGNVLVWVKLHGVPVTAFSEDGLSAIATKIGTTLILDSYTYDMCSQSWGRSSYARALIEVRADVELKDNIVVAMPKLDGEGFYTCVLVGLKVGFQQTVYRQVSKKNNVSTSGNKKKNAEPKIEVSKSNSFDVLNSVENDVDMDYSGTSTIPIVEKIDKMERLIIDGTTTLMDDEGKPLTRVDSSGDHDNKDEVESESYGDGEYDYDPYDDDMYEGQDIPNKIQDICDNLDIKVRGRKKK
ncbi:retrotransposon protein, putative, ty1-copia subclass [Tanacetum coccineum]